MDNLNSPEYPSNGCMRQVENGRKELYYNGKWLTIDEVVLISLNKKLELARLEGFKEGVESVLNKTEQ